MSKKTLLEEATVRRFMKLANVSTLSDQLISEMGYGDHMGARDEEEEEGVEMADETPEMPEDEGPEEAPMADEEPMADEAEMEVEITEDDRATLEAALAVLAKITGAEAGGEEMDMGMEEPMADEEPMEEMAYGKRDDEEPMEEGHGKDHDEEEAMKEGTDLSTKGAAGKGTFSGQKDHKLTAMKEGEEEELEEGEEVLDEVEVVDEGEIVNEVTRRVAKRLRSILNKNK
mgnify:CR=1 FL=1